MAIIRRLRVTDSVVSSTSARRMVDPTRTKTPSSGPALVKQCGLLELGYTSTARSWASVIPRTWCVRSSTPMRTVPPGKKPLADFVDKIYNSLLANQSRIYKQLITIELLFVARNLLNVFFFNVTSKFS
jgi:hypothetical protein